MFKNKKSMQITLATCSCFILCLVTLGLFMRYLQPTFKTLYFIYQLLFLSFAGGLLLAWLILKITAIIHHTKLLKEIKVTPYYQPQIKRLLIAGFIFTFVSIIGQAKLAGRIELLTRKKDSSVYKVKDIVLIAIMSVATILFCGVMPLVLPLITKLFGVAQLATTLQTTFFFSIALTKIKKPYALLLMALIMGLILLPMSWIMALTIILPALLIEMVNFLFLGKYQSNYAIFAAVSSLYPLSTLLLYLSIFTIDQNKSSLITDYKSLVVSVVIILLSYLGAFLGIRIVNEITRVKARRSK